MSRVPTVQPRDTTFTVLYGIIAIRQWCFYYSDPEIPSANSAVGSDLRIPQLAFLR